MPDDRILVGVLGAPHGVRGELRLKSYTQDPLAIADYSPLEDPTGKRTFVVVAARPVKDDMLVVRLEGVEDRDAAAALTNTRLFVPRDRLPPPEDEDEFYHADLIGLSVETLEGEKIGTVQAVLDFGAGEILEIRPSDGARAFMLPFTKDVVPNVDVKNGRMIVTIPAEVEGHPEVSKNGETSD